MAYTIKEISRLAGVSTRTIRYYDQIGLLPPAEIGGNGYRYYDRSSLLALQQILFFRELDVPLKKIIQLMSMPDFNPLEALSNHRRSLQKKAARTQALIQTLNKTISMIEGDQSMAEKEIFKGFDEEKYAEEAKARWGGTESYKISLQRWASYSHTQQEEIKAKGGEITTRMVGVNAAIQPDDAGVQQAIGEYLAYLNQYFYPCDAEFLRGLAEMWVTDARFAVNYERIREGGAQFVREAVNYFCDNRK
jgi:DNA-binding transcriptional MerR regulator